jgi:DNA-binding FadR family transcriptional regulator
MMDEHETDGGGSSARIHRTIARNLGTAILAGEYKPGEKLGGEIERSESLRISRTAYREAIRILIAKGMIESKPKAGTRITPRRKWNLLDPEVLDWMFSTRPDRKFVDDLFELRDQIEPSAAALAAKRHTAAQLAAMDEALRNMKKYGLATAEGQEADQVFHSVLLEATHNEALATLASTIGAAVRWTTRFKQERMPNPRDPLDEHIALRDAIASRDPEAASATMRELLHMALQDMGEEA